MARKEAEVENFLEKVNTVKEGSLDLSSDEDLSIGIMNLISIEEHLFFTANKTNKDKYYALLNEIREMRKVLLKEIIIDYEGEVWCISKHLLASSMRMMEVGTKALTKGENAKAKDLFQKSYRLWRLFWEINLKLDVQEPRTEIKTIKSNHKQPGYDPDDVILFYDVKCEHCKNLEWWLTKNNLYTVFNIIKKEVSMNPENYEEMQSLYNTCVVGQEEMTVPLVHHDGKCFVGEEDITKMLKDELWQTVREKQDTLKTMMKESDTPKHIQKHQEHIDKILDTALNCCKE